ncbi:MAG TPA: D-glycero-beta-D-manno-heptose 1-phosphate adenylyltransferase [Tepidisphaeraceae bacterium]
MSTRLIQLVETLPACRIVLVGDLMIDHYLYGNAERLSQDAPVPVMHYQREEFRLGGAGRVAADLATLGAQVEVVSVVGSDATAKRIRALLAECGASDVGLLDVPGRPSTCKMRFVGLAQHRHPQQMIRVDYEDASPIDSQTAQRVLEACERALPGAAALCIEDYNKGLLTGELCEKIIQLARKHQVPVFVDPAAISDYHKYSGSSAITPNRIEAEKASGLKCTSEIEYRATAEKLLNDLQLDAAVLTLDKSGAYVATREGARAWMKTRERKVYDVAGAGDMLLAMLTAARVAGASWEEAVALGNVAAGLEVERAGSVPITRTEIIQELLSEVREHLGKQRTLEHLLPELARHRAMGKRIVFTNGCFDIVHLGHVKYFQLARKQGDLLVVGVNTDAGIQRLKGAKRPIINEVDRLGVLEELQSIDYLVTFDEDTPIKLIEAIKPDVLVKGADYKKEQVVGWDVVERNGGRVFLAPLVDGRSTSTVIQKILEAYKS